jgi:hypothetical protein
MSMDRKAVAMELVAVAKELVAVKFDTRKELQKYKTEHGTRPGTRLELRNEHEMRQRRKDKA